MKKFEYKEFRHHRYSNHAEKLNEFGLEGWELVCVESHPDLSLEKFFFKREIEQSATEQNTNNRE